MSNRYTNKFAKLKQQSAGAYVPFVMLADPTIHQSFEIIKTLIDHGADALELGIPFSDPIADGPVIQQAAIRALSNGTSVSACFELLKKVREYDNEIPIGLLVYSNLVVSNSINHFYQQAAESGVDSVLVADVPVIEAQPFVNAAKRYNVDPIFIATPNANDATLRVVSELGQGYTYLLSRAGVTGTDVKADMPLERIVQSLKANQAPPALLGFGIANPSQVKQAIQSGADGAISGSAVVKIIEKNLAQPQLMLSELAEFTEKMKLATLPT
ncbi:tryptophan synthase subunit alpha [Aliikangiella sp. IMCC44632]